MNYLPICTPRLVVQHPCQVSFKSMRGCRKSWKDKLKCVKILSAKCQISAKSCRQSVLPSFRPSAPAKFVFSTPTTSLHGFELNLAGMLHHNSRSAEHELSPTCTSKLVVQYPCQVSFKSIQGCRRSWEDKLKGRSQSFSFLIYFFQI